MGVKTSQQPQSFVFDAVKIQSHCLALHTVGYPVPPGRKARGQTVSVFLVNYCEGGGRELLFKIQKHYRLSISQVDPSEGGVELWSRLTLMVLIKKDGRATDLHAQLLCSLKLISK